MPVDVLRAGTDDAAALADLRWRWRVGERGEHGMAREQFDAAFAAWMSEHAATHLAWLARSDGYAVGMAWLAVLDRVPGPGRWLRLSGNLQSVYVVPEHRDRGVGGQLVDAAVTEARRRGLDYVAVHPSERSFPLYRRAGFTEHAGVLELPLSVRL